MTAKGDGEWGRDNRCVISADSHSTMSVLILSQAASSIPSHLLNIDRQMDMGSLIQKLLHPFLLVFCSSFWLRLFSRVPSQHWGFQGSACITGNSRHFLLLCRDILAPFSLSLTVFKTDSSTGKKKGKKKRPGLKLAAMVEESPMAVPCAVCQWNNTSKQGQNAFPLWKNRSSLERMGEYSRHHADSQEELSRRYPQLHRHKGAVGWAFMARLYICLLKALSGAWGTCCTWKMDQVLWGL